MSLFPIIAHLSTVFTQMYKRVVETSIWTRPRWRTDRSYATVTSSVHAEPNSRQHEGISQTLLPAAYL